jgi:nitrogen regulatory protein P-II 2
VKYIIAIIQPDRLDTVVEALGEKGINLMTVTEVLGRGRQRGVAEVYRNHQESGSLLRKIKIEIGIQDHRAQEAIDAITLGAYTGNIGDGKIFVLDMMECVRIRTAETGDNAVA